MHTGCRERPADSFLGISVVADHEQRVLNLHTNILISLNSAQAS